MRWVGIILLITIQSVYGQAFNNKPVLGDRFLVYHISNIDMLDSVKVAEAGGRITWNLNDAFFSNKIDTILYHNTDTDSLSRFVQFNLIAYYSETNTNNFYYIDDRKMELRGIKFGERDSFWLPYDPLIVRYYPFLYNFTYIDTGIGRHIIMNDFYPKVHENLYYKYYVDAYGTLIIDNKTYDNITRVKLEWDKRVLKVIFPFKTDTIYGVNYLFFVPDLPEPILEISYYYDELGNKHVTGKYIQRITTNITSVENKNFVKIYPTAVNDVLNLEFFPNVYGKGKINMINSLGKVIYSKQIDLNYEKALHINIKDLPSGIYLVKISVGDKFMYKKIVKL